MTGIFLDRRILLDRLINSGSTPVVGLDGYDTVAYEASGVSGLESALDRAAELRGKLVGIPSSELAPVPADAKLFAQTLDVAAKTPAIMLAARQYQQSARSHAEPMESVSYTLRLLSAVRSGGMDLGLHRERLPILLHLFAESGVKLENTTDSLFVSEPCGFPYLPHAVPGSTVYRIVPVGDEGHGRPTPAPRSADISAPTGKRVFIAYSHKNQTWLERLLEVLKPFVRAGDIDVWSDERITASQLWRDEIDQALAAADAGIMLVSTSFLASDFVTDHEIPALLKRHQTDNMPISWIAVSDSLYKHTPIEPFQALNDPGRPLDQLTVARRQRELVKIAEKIRDILVSGS
jgi:hypothetical protein